MPCSAVTLSLATISAIVAVALLAIAFSTDNWLTYEVKRNNIQVCIRFVIIQYLMFICRPHNVDTSHLTNNRCKLNAPCPTAFMPNISEIQYNSIYIFDRCVSRIHTKQVMVKQFSVAIMGVDVDSEAIECRDFVCTHMRSTSKCITFFIHE